MGSGTSKADYYTPEMNTQEKELPIPSPDDLLSLVLNEKFSEVEELLPEKLDVWDFNKRDKDGNTPLLVLASKGSLSTIKCFLISNVNLPTVRSPGTRNFCLMISGTFFPLSTITGIRSGYLFLILFANSSLFSFG